MTPLLTSRQVAQILSCHEHTVEGAYRRGELPGVRLGRLLRFTSEDVAAFVAAHRTAPRETAQTAIYEVGRAPANPRRRTA